MSSAAFTAPPSSGATLASSTAALAPSTAPLAPQSGVPTVLFPSPSAPTT
jgi:hypothetical protein